MKILFLQKYQNNGFLNSFTWIQFLHWIEWWKWYDEVLYERQVIIKNIWFVMNLIKAIIKAIKDYQNKKYWFQGNIDKIEEKLLVSMT